MGFINLKQVRDNGKRVSFQCIHASVGMTWADAKEKKAA